MKQSIFICKYDDFVLPKKVLIWGYVKTILQGSQTVDYICNRIVHELQFSDTRLQMQAMMLHTKWLTKPPSISPANRFVLNNSFLISVS